MLKISIPEPCTKNWEDMKADGCGRFCASCEKTVVDFTKMDDAAFISYFQQTKTPPCGRFLTKQLALEIPSKPISFPLFKRMNKYVTASILTTTIMGGKAFGQQTATVQMSADKQKENAPQNALPAGGQTIEIRGNVVDQAGEIVPGATVSIKSLDVKTYTDLDGNFTLLFPKAWYTNNAPLSLTVAATGSDEVILLLKQEEFKAVKVHLPPAVLGGPEYYRPNRWQRLKHWVSNNFS